MKWRGGPLAQVQAGDEDKRPRLASKQSFQAQFLANLAIMEEECSDPWPDMVEVLESIQSPGTSTSQMVVYSGPQAGAGKVPFTALTPVQWPWDPGSAAGVTGSPGMACLGMPQVVGVPAASAGNLVPGWAWASEQVPPALGFGCNPWWQQQQMGCPGWGVSVLSRVHL